MQRQTVTFLVGFALGVVVAVLMVFATGGAYEYRYPDSSEVQHLINDEHWQIVPGHNPDQNGYFYLRRKRLRLP